MTDKQLYFVYYKNSHYKILKFIATEIEFDSYADESAKIRIFKINNEVAKKELHNIYGEKVGIFITEDAAKAYVKEKEYYQDNLKYLYFANKEDLDNFYNDNTISIGHIYDTVQQIKYEEEIDKVLSEDFVRKEEYNDVRICRTPEVYGKIGLDIKKDMLMSREHIRYDNKIHGIKKEQFYNLPKLLEEPAIIMKSMSKDKAIVTILNDIDQNKLPLMAAIEPNGKGTFDFKQIDSNFIMTVYGRNKFENFVNKALEENKLLFTDQKVINELEKKAGIEIFKDEQVLTKNNILQK